MTAFRMLSHSTTDEMVIDLAHGYRPQKTMPLFKRQHQVGDVTTLRRRIEYPHLARRWISEHASQYDIFYGLTGFDFTVIPAYAAQRAGLPAVIKLASHETDLVDKPGLKRLYGAPRRRRKKIKELTHIVAISQGIREELLGYGVDERRISLIPNGVDTELFRPARTPAERQRSRARHGLGDGAIVLLVGALVRRKQPHLLLDAAAILKQSGILVNLVFAGPCSDPKYFAELEARTTSLQIRDQVRFLGFMEDCSDLYRAADFFVLPSVNEGMPNALLEAMASGLKCIALPIPGVTDLIDHEVSGWFIDDDAASLAKVLRSAMADVANEVGSGARKKIVDNFSAVAVYQKHLALFRTLVRRDGRSRCRN